MSVTRIHTTNPTKIKKIPGHEIVLSLISVGGGQVLNAEFPDLGTLVPDKLARVSVLVEAGQTRQTFDFGTVGSISPPHDRTLKDIDSNKPMTIRATIWDPATKQILAANNRLKFQEAEGDISKKSLLPTRLADLGGELWQLAINEGEEPELLLNENVPDVTDAVRHTPELLVCIFPEAIRQTLVHLAYSRDFDLADEEAWQSNWIKWLATNGHPWDASPNPIEDDEIEINDVRQWATNIVSAFAIELDLLQPIVDNLGSASDD